MGEKVEFSEVRHWLEAGNHVGRHTIKASFRLRAFAKGTWQLVAFTACFGGRIGWGQQTVPELTHSGV